MSNHQNKKSIQLHHDQVNAGRDRRNLKMERRLQFAVELEEFYTARNVLEISICLLWLVGVVLLCTTQVEYIFRVLY